MKTIKLSWLVIIKWSTFFYPYGTFIEYVCIGFLTPSTDSLHYGLHRPYPQWGPPLIIMFATIKNHQVLAMDQTCRVDCEDSGRHCRSKGRWQSSCWRWFSGAVWGLVRGGGRGGPFEKPTAWRCGWLWSRSLSWRPFGRPTSIWTPIRSGH